MSLCRNLKGRGSLESEQLAQREGIKLKVSKEECIYSLQAIIGAQFKDNAKS